jgi:hypothetical protein
MSKPGLRLVVPTTEKRTVTPKRAKNCELRTREYLTEGEVERLMVAARQNRHGHRDATMILIAFRHGLRASELVDLHWDQVDFQRAVLHVRRAKGGTPSVHPLTGLEMRALRRLQRESEASAFVFVSERGGAVHDGRICKDDAARSDGDQPKAESPSTHATARLWLRPGQLRARYPRFAGISRTQEYSAHGPLHRVGTRPIQEILEGLRPSLMRMRAAGSGEPDRLSARLCLSRRSHGGVTVESRWSHGEVTEQ